MEQCKVASYMPDDFVSHIGRKWSDEDIKTYNSAISSINIYFKDCKPVPQVILDSVNDLITKYTKVG